MNNIRIVNLRNHKADPMNETLIKIDRSSLLGNPYYMQYEGQRDEVCDKYETYFKDKIKSDRKFIEELNTICEIAKSRNIALGCWCYPKRCHAETIKEYIENTLNETF